MVLKKIQHIFIMTLPAGKSLFINFLQRVYFVVFCCIVLIPAVAQAQSHLKGKVVDEQTKEPLSFVSITIEGDDVGTYTDEKGKFYLRTLQPSGTLMINSLGYKQVKLSFTGNIQETIFLEQDNLLLQEVEIKPERKRYRNKNNPAVELIRQVIAHKEENILRKTPNLQYQEYSRLSLSLINPGKELTNSRLLQRYNFMFQNIDSISQPGKKLLPIYLKEDIYKKYFRSTPKQEKTIHKAHKKVEFDNRLVNNESTSEIFKYIIQDIDLYDNNIYLLTNSFLSPVADNGPLFYKYYITDTVYRQDEPFVQLSYVPRNNEDLLFYGELEVAIKRNYAVTKAVLKLSRYANVNWINNLQATLKYKQAPDGRFIPDEYKLLIDFGLDYLPNSILAQHTRVFTETDYQTVLLDSLFTGKEMVKKMDSSTEAYLQAHRPVVLSTSEQQIYQNYDSLNSMPSFNRLLRLGSFLLGGYLNLGVVELGSYGTFYTRNPVEGVKLRLAGRTTTQFSNRIFLSGNISYGFGDKKWKHFGAFAYSLNKNSIFDFPQHSIQLSHAYDSRIPGLDFQFREEENPLLSFKRGSNNKYLYADVWRLEYVVEAKENIRLELAMERTNQEAIGGLKFLPAGPDAVPEVKDITSTEAAINVRWAHKERLLDKMNGRKSIPNIFPAISVYYGAGLKGLLGGQYAYHKLRLKIAQRIILSQFGHADVMIGGGKLWGKVPYPLLFIPRANQSYGYYLTSYNLMNFMEFVGDQYAEASIDYHMHGFLLNKIPLIKIFDLREVFGIKVLYGNLSSINTPGKSRELFQLPRDEFDRLTSFPMGREPYVEYNIGIENILNVLRIDYVGRLNYLHHPQAPKWGIRFRLHISF